MARSTSKTETSTATAGRKTRKKAAATKTRKTTSRKTRGAAAAAPGASPDAPAIGSALERLEGVAARLDASCQALAGSLNDVPTPADFEPLAEHLYQLARYAPRLLEALEALPRVEASVASLQEISETLQYVQTSFDESMLKLPRGEDYEPLAEPLREFARVSPALAESLGAVLRTTTPLADAVRDLRQLSAELRGGRSDPGAPTLPTPAPDIDVRPELERTRDDVAVAHSALREALDSLPADTAYKRVAEQLREIASVSPSLMEWLSQVEPITRPLGASVDGLRAAVERLEAARERLHDALEALGPTRSGAAR